MSRRPVRALVGVCAAGLAGSMVVSSVPATAGDRAVAQHVLLLSVDGLHQSDLDWYVKNNPHSALARLVGGGADYTHAKVQFPTDSFPGIIGQLTGGTPGTTGAYYDDTWNQAMLPAGTSMADCMAGKVPPGAEVTYMEAAARDPLRLDSGSGQSLTLSNILQLTGDARSLLDPNALPVDPKSCRPVYPDQYIRVNTVFEVARAANMRTAWSDKHAAYEVLNGPSTTGVQDLFTPEINSTASAAGNDFTTDNALTQMYDSTKVQAVINEINGLDHSGAEHVGTPAVFGMNFQTVSTAQKLPAGGYTAGGAAPGNLLVGALDFINAKVGAMMAAIEERGLSESTVVILSAKHGQSPLDPAQLTRIADGPIVDAVNAAWTATTGSRTPLVSFSVNDDGMLMWLSDRSDKATAFVAAQLMSGVTPFTSATLGNGITGKPKAYTTSGLASVKAGKDAWDYFHVSPSDPVGFARVPDIIGFAQVGTVYTGKKAKIAEHGGYNPGDYSVPIVVSGAGIDHTVQTGAVTTEQIAPTILRLLGLDPNKLKAVQIEGTRTLPGLTGGDN